MDNIKDLQRFTKALHQYSQYGSLSKMGAFIILCYFQLPSDIVRPDKTA